MDRHSWIDVALGSVVAILCVTAWHFPLRDLWTYVLHALGRTGPVFFIGTGLIILFHIAWIAVASYIATRSLRVPVRVWRRLYPLAVILTAAIWGVSLAESMALGGGRNTIWTLSDLILTANAAYTVLWIAAWVILRRRRTEAPADAPPIWRRPGPWIWVSVWIVGLALEYVV